MRHGSSSGAASAPAARACARNTPSCVRAGSNGVSQGALKYTALTSRATVSGSEATPSSTMCLMWPAVAPATQAFTGAAPSSGAAEALKASATAAA